MSKLSTKVVAGAATVLAAAGFAMFAGQDANAVVSTKFTVTNLSTHRLPSLTKNQVITVTGTGFDEDLIDSVNLSNCTSDLTYVVNSASSMLVKTPDDCANSTSAVLTITDSSNAVYTATPGTNAKLALVFVSAPTIGTAAAAFRPVLTDNSANMGYADQTTTVSTTGGQTIRIYSGSVKFISTTTYKPAVMLDGVALTNVTVHDPTTSVNYITGVVGAHAADAAPVLKITNNGVTKSFVYGAGGSSAVDQTFDLQYAGNTVAVSPASGPMSGGTKITITGAGFTTGSTVKLGTVTCPVSGTNTTTKIVCTTPIVASGGTAGPVEVQVTTGSTTSIVSAGSTFTYLP